MNDYERQHEKQRLKLPNDWAKTLRPIPNRSASVDDLKKLFGVSHSTLNRWRRAEPDFAAAILLKMKNAHQSRAKTEEPKSNEEIDVEKVFLDLRMLHLSTKNRHDKDVLAKSLEAISLLRVEVRRLKSEKQLARERLHFRATSRGNGTHASGGGASNQGLGGALPG